MIKRVSIQAFIGIQDPQFSWTTYIVGCISTLVIYWWIGHIFHFQNLNYSENNTNLSYRVAFFMITTLIQLWIWIIFLFFGYVYPDLKLLGFVLGFVTGGMCGFTSMSTIAIMVKDRTKIRTAKYFILHCVLSILYWVLMLWVFTTIANWYLFLDSSAYVIFSNIWVVLIIVNAFLKTRCFVNFGIMSVVMLTICLSSLSILKPNDYFQSLSLSSASNLSIFHSMCIFFIYLQSKYGSRFFLPKLLRSKIYDKFKNNVYSDFNSLKSLQCQKWTNYILEPEFEYSDSDPLFKMQKYPIGTYIQTPWLHSFHPNWILKHIEDNQWWPVCNYQLAKNTYDD